MALFLRGQEKGGTSARQLRVVQLLVELRTERQVLQKDRQLCVFQVLVEFSAELLDQPGRGLCSSCRRAV